MNHPKNIYLNINNDHPQDEHLGGLHLATNEINNPNIIYLKMNNLKNIYLDINNDHPQDEHHGGIHLATWRWKKYSSALMFTGFPLY